MSSRQKFDVNALDRTAQDIYGDARSDRLLGFCQRVVHLCAEYRQLERENDLAREEIRVREESQIPVIPHEAAAKIERLQDENECLREAIREAIWVVPWDEIDADDVREILSNAFMGRERKR